VRYSRIVGIAPPCDTVEVRAFLRVMVTDAEPHLITGVRSICFFLLIYVKLKLRGRGRTKKTDRGSPPSLYQLF